jgi:uncharacterized protein YjbI with pentapeptide repeats
MTGSDFTSADASGAILIEAGLTRATLDKTLFKDANLQSVFLNLVRGLLSDFSGANLRRAYMTGSALIACRFDESHAEFSQGQRTDFSGSSFVRVTMDRANLQQANFSLADMEEASIRGCPLMKANFCASNLKKAKFTRSNLDGAQLLGVDAQGALINGANLRGAFMAEGNFTGANFNQSLMQEIVTDNAVFDQASFEGAKR